METNKNYGRGFIYKCAEMGIDPITLIEATAVQVKKADDSLLEQAQEMGGDALDSIKEQGSGLMDQLGGMKDSALGAWEDLDEDTKNIVLRALAGGGAGAVGGGIYGAATAGEGESMGDSALSSGLLGGLLGTATGAGSEALFQALDGNDSGSIMDEGSDLLERGREGLSDLVDSGQEGLSDLVDSGQEGLSDLINGAGELSEDTISQIKELIESGKGKAEGLFE